MSEGGIIILNRNEIQEKIGFCYLAKVSGTAFLCRKELAYYQSLKFERRKSSYLLGRMAAKKALGQLYPHIKYENMHIAFGVFDFPTIKDTSFGRNMQVSISHAGGLALALAFPEEHPMGVDMERVDTKQTEAIEGQMTTQDIAFLQANQLYSKDGLTLLWSMKEALSKVLKTGFMIDFQLLEINSLEIQGKQYIATFRHFPQYKALGYIHNGFTYAIVLPQRTEAMMEEFERVVVGEDTNYGVE